MKNGKSGLLLFGLLFGGIGLAMLGGAMFAFDHARSFQSRAARAEGTVKELVLSHSRSGTHRSSTYSPVVEFETAKGERIQFTGSVSSNPPAYRPGESVVVLYLPDDPYTAGIGSFWQQWFLVVILAAMGGIFTVLAVWPFIHSARAAHRRAWLRREGKVIRARFQGVEQASGRRVGRRRPYQIISHWLNPETGELRVFHSENIWFDPTPYIDRESIEVWVDPGDPRKYHVDIDFLPRLVD